MAHLQLMTTIIPNFKYKLAVFQTRDYPQKYLYYLSFVKKSFNL